MQNLRALPDNVNNLSSWQEYSARLFILNNLHTISYTYLSRHYFGMASYRLVKLFHCHSNALKR